MSENKNRTDIERILLLNKKVNEKLKSDNKTNFIKESLKKINKNS